MSSKSKEIGQRIKVARRAAKLSQTELAVRLDKTMRTIQKYESGEIEPSFDMVNAMALILQVSPAELVGYQKSEVQIDTIADVIAAVYQMDKKGGLRIQAVGNSNETLSRLLEEYDMVRGDEDACEQWVTEQMSLYAQTKL